MNAASPHTLITLPIDTKEGRFIARYSTRGLVRLDFPGAGRAERVSASARVSPRLRAWHRLTTAALKRALAGRTPPRLPPLDWSRATRFQRRVWSALLQLGPGQTCGYGEMARRVGCPGGARAVGGACRANPIPVLVPCHRVLAARGRLGGFSAGTVWKRRLLARESAGVQ